MIHVDHMIKQYDTFRLDVSFDIEPGRVTGIVGRNGAGKTTMLKILLGLKKADGAGAVQVLGKPVTALTPEDRKQLGVALADAGFNPNLTVRDVAAVLKAEYDTFDEPMFRDSCGQYGLAYNKRIKDLSTGMNARLRVLVALSHKARLLILDEPTAGLDVVARNEVLDMIRSYLAEDPERTLLISSHISSDLEGLCDDIYMIHDGAVIVHEDTDTILSEYGLIKASDDQYEKIDRQYIVREKKESFGWLLLTDHRQFYAENYRDLIIENGNIDELIVMMSEGEKK